MPHHPNGAPVRWLTPFAPRSQVRLRLFCFPSAGGGAAQYRLWPQHLPHDVELHAVQLPGRESRLRETPLRRADAIIEAIGRAIAPFAGEPFAIFGHSMGALLAFEVTRWLRRAGHPLPAHLFVSGRRAPQLPASDAPLHALDDAAFVREIVRRYNGIPTMVLEDPELLALFLPTLRADLEVIETYAYAAEPPLACPITACGGMSDGRVRRFELEAWRDQTAASFGVRQFLGEHFYLQDERANLLAAVVAALDAGVACAHGARETRVLS